MENISNRINKADDGIRLIVKNAKIINRNFSGAERKDQSGRLVNAKGKRNFCVVFSEEEAAALQADGWNVRFKKDGTPFIPVEARYDIPEYQPTIFYIDCGNKINVTEDTVDALDDVDIADAEVTIRPYHYDVNGKTGVKAYLTKLKIALVEDDFLTKHNVVPTRAFDDGEPLPFN